MFSMLRRILFTWVLGGETDRNDIHPVDCVTEMWHLYINYESAMFDIIGTRLALAVSAISSAAAQYVVLPLY